MTAGRTDGLMIGGWYAEMGTSLFDGLRVIEQDWGGSGFVNVTGWDLRDGPFGEM